MVVSGKLPNNTVWWLSTDGKKIWIESEELEQEKFKEKKYNVAHGRIFYARKDVGELATSRLDSRKHKDAWIIKLEAILDVYPTLLDEINRKEIEEKKKKRPKDQSKDKKSKKIEQKSDIIIEEPKKEIIIETNNNIPKKEINTETNNNIPKKEIITETNNKEPVYFDINLPYVTWIKDEISKSEDGTIIIPINDLKEKMGKEFIKLDNFRIYFGLNKILANDGIIVELGSAKKECIAIIKKT